MNVRELQEQLSGFDDDMEVVFSYRYGDHCNHLVTESIGHRQVNEVTVEYSEYCQRYVIQSDEYMDQDERQKDVVVLGEFESEDSY